jgi:isoquinoline 1-oxidoreductase beta subunit
MPHLSNAFAVESFIDEIAHSMKEDPLDTHLRLLGEARQVPLSGGGTFDTGRLINVLKLVADRIEWKNWLHSVNGLGIACWHFNGAYVAHAIEVAMQGEKLSSSASSAPSMSAASSTRWVWKVRSPAPRSMRYPLR